MDTPPSSRQTPPSGPPEDGAPDIPGRRKGNGPPKASLGQRAARALRRDKKPYPHDTHPGLVPGIAVDDQRVRYRTDPLVFGVAAVLVLAFVAWGVFSTESLKSVSDLALSWVVKNTGWLFSSLLVVVLVFMLFIGFSRYGKIPLGVDGEKPEYSKFSWVAMMFSAGVGIGLFFFGPYEPLTYYMTPAPGEALPETTEALHKSMAQTYFHWGFNAWAIYALVGAAVAYGSYRRGRVPLMSTIFTPLLGRRRTEGAAGRLIDMFAIVATLFGTAASLGIGALQIGRGVEIVGGIGQLPNAALIGIIAILTAAFIASAVSGVSRGIRMLSNVNMSLTIALVAFIFLTGPTLFLLNLIPASITEYLSELLHLMSKGPSWGAEAADFSANWTVFYWAWWISWSPFVGIFLARISRGRTLREYVQYVLVVPTLVCVLAFGIFGGTTIWMRMQGADISAESAPEALFFQMLDQLPLSSITPLLAMFCVAIFFITSADSASLVMGSLSQRGKPRPDRKVTVFWGLAMMGIAVVMLLVGGNEALSGLQNLIIVSALPFAVILALMMVAFTRDLQTDPLIIRREYATAALEQAVRTGIDEHGDDFAIAVKKAPQGQGAGADFDSHDKTVTDWYQRRDEDGKPVDYDYESGEYADGWTPEDAEEGSGEEPDRDKDSGLSPDPQPSPVR